MNEYLDERYRQVPLMHKDLAQRARARIWVDFCNTRLHGAAQDILHGGEPEKGREKLRGYFSILDREMNGRDYLVGDYSLADVTFIPFFLRQQRYGVAIDQTAPRLKNWMERLLARPAVRSTIEPAR
ncbi:MAG: glutathione S-transferase family protein [Candidatus Binatia bacterium]